MQEAQDLSLLVDKMIEGKETGRALTHFHDGTTKKRVGQFVVQGIFIGKDNPFPLPILPISGESTFDVAMQVDMAMEILAAIRGVEAKEIYKLLDTNMTDSTEHKKGFAAFLAEIYDLEKPAGQLYCGTHTTLGFAAAMNKVMRHLEAKMRMENMTQSFMLIWTWIV